LLKQMTWGNDIAPAFGHLLAVWVKDPAADDHVVPRDPPLMQVGFHNRVERPGTDDLVALWTDVHGEQLLVPLGIVNPMTHNLWAQRTRGPGVHHIRIANETIRLASHCLVKARPRLGKRIHGKLRRVRQDRVVIAGPPLSIYWIPDREWHAEITLAADAPVLVKPLDPVLIARPHERGVPLNTGALFQEFLLLVQESDKPLAGRNEFQRLFSLLVKLHRRLDL